MRIKNFVCGDWSESTDVGSTLYHAVTGREVATASTVGINFEDVLSYGRKVGGPAMRNLTFHDRAARLKQLAVYLTERKEEFYLASQPTGSTRNDAWIDIEGGIGTFFVYASKGRRDFPNERHAIDGGMEKLSKLGSFVGQHICVPLEGVAVHINAFNFPCWGMLEKLAPTFLAGMPAIVKPATCTSYLSAKMVQAIIESEILPKGALQLLCGSIGDLFDHLTSQDVVTFTGSQSTALKLKLHSRIQSESIRFNQETDSLNCSILGPESGPGTEEFDLYIKEVAREMTVKAGQKCTVIRRAIVPRQFVDAVSKSLAERLSKVCIGNPLHPEVKMGPLVSKDQVRDVREQVQKLKQSCEVVFGNNSQFALLDADASSGAFFQPTLLYCKNPLETEDVHRIEAFGPVSTLLPYENIDEAIEIARRGEGSLVGSLFTSSEKTARDVTFGIAPYHGRLVILDASSAKESTGHGSPLPHLKHGGPGRAGGGEELGGSRSVYHYMERIALQGSPTRLSQIANTWLTGAAQVETPTHPFRKHFEELQIGETLITKDRKITREDVEQFAALSGDHFYAHMDEAAAESSLFGKRVAHGYFIVSAAAGLFVDPAPGPVLANYGLENLRFTKPVYFDDVIRVRLTCKQKSPKSGENHGIVTWDVEITNQNSEVVATYAVLTLVKRLTQ